MHLLLLHGYLLQGSGSNIYVANIAKAWRRQGHAVTLVCQDRQAANLPFVHEYIGPSDSVPPGAPAPGRIRVVVPPINDVLPVYVMGRYDGFEVKTIPMMTSEEIETHIEMTAAAVSQVAEQGVDRVFANHVMLGPVIAKRALDNRQVPYDVKIHGSAVEYTLVPNLHLMKYAVEGLEGAGSIFAGTRYVRDRVLEIFAAHRVQLELDQKLQIVPPGMDPELFRPAEDFSTNHNRFVQRIGRTIDENPNGRHRHVIPSHRGHSSAEYHKALVELGESYDQRVVDADLLERWPIVRQDEPIVLFVGNFLGSKGVGELLLTAPAVLSRLPQIRFVFAGYGPCREHLEGMIRALGAGDRDAFAACARAGAFVEADIDRWFRPLTPEELGRITVTGMLDHDALSALLPLASVSVVPSKWPEAFGMVAVEALSAGVLCLCNYHAGLRDIVDEVASAAPELGNLMRLDRERFVEQLPESIEAALAYLFPGGYGDLKQRRKAGEVLRGIAVERFSWDGIAGRLLKP